MKMLLEIGKAVSIYPKSLRAFSLIELMVVIALIGGIIAIAIPTLGVIFGADVKEELNKIIGLMNEVYDRAAILGKTHRIVFDISNNQYWVEEKSLEAGEFAPELGYDEDFGEDKKGLFEEEKALRPQFEKVKGEWADKFKLKSSVSIYGVWVEGIKEALREGFCVIYFFPGGYTQSAFVSLSKKDEDKPEIYLALTPLTGEITTGPGEPKIDDLIENISE